MNLSLCDRFKIRQYYRFDSPIDILEEKLLVVKNQSLVKPADFFMVFWNRYIASIYDVVLTAPFSPAADTSGKIFSDPLRIQTVF